MTRARSTRSGASSAAASSVRPDPVFRRPHRPACASGRSPVASAPVGGAIGGAVRLARRFARSFAVAGAVLLVGAVAAEAPLPEDNPLLLSSTYLGGSVDQFVSSVKYGPDGALWLTGWSHSS